MYSIVKPIREKGKRRSDRSISADPGYAGELKMYRVAAEPMLELVRRRPLTSIDDPVLPTLHRPVLTGLGTSRMRVEGWEQADGEDGPMYLQEWAIEFRQWRLE